MIRRLARAGVRFVLHHEWTRIADGALCVRDTLSGEEAALPASVVVAAIGNDIVDELSPSADAEVVVVGDCVALRTVLEAIREGRLAGLAI